MIAIRALGVLALCSTAAGVLGAQPLAPPTQPGPASSAAPTEAAALGRLFFTPAQRAALDDARRRPRVAAVKETAPLPPPPQYVTLNGVVRRSDGTTTVWLNNKSVRGNQTEEGLQIAPPMRSTPAGNVTVRVPQTGRVVSLKVGQQVDVTSGQVEEGYRAAQRQQGSAAEPHPDAAAQADTDTRAQRRANRERDRLRDLLREMDDAGNARSDTTPGESPATP